MGLFDVSYEKQATKLRGKLLRVGPRTFTLNEVVGYAKKENDAGVYRPIVAMAPGSVYFPQHRNSILFLIACRDGGAYGGCVLVGELLSGGAGTITGPKNVTEAVGVCVPKSTGRVIELSNGELLLQLDTAQSGIRKEPKTESAKKPKAIGKKVLERLMPLIAGAYQRQKGGGTFQGFLQGLLDRCHSENELRVALRNEAAVQGQA